MRNPFQTSLRNPWPLLCAALLLCYAFFPFSRRDEIDLADSALLLFDVLLFVVSLPLSLFVMLGLSELGLGRLQRSQFWALSLTLGYFQWFHLVPLLFGRRPAPVVTLNLAADGEVASSAAAETPPAEARPALPDDADAPPIPQFNECGRTPLERVFDNQS